MNPQRRTILFALLASPFAIAASQAATPNIPDLPEGTTAAPGRQRRSGHDDERRSGEDRHSERRHDRKRDKSKHRSRRHHDGDDD